MISLNEAKFTELKQLFSKNGYHFTKQRQLICEKLLNSPKKYLTGTEIFNYLKSENTDLCLATVYRTIDVLEKIGLLKKAMIKDKVIKYQVCFNCTEEIHGHLVCKHCNNIFKLESENLNKLIAEIRDDYDFIIENHFINFKGVCANCKQELNIVR